RTVLFVLLLPPPRPTLFPYTTLFRSRSVQVVREEPADVGRAAEAVDRVHRPLADRGPEPVAVVGRQPGGHESTVGAAHHPDSGRSEEHTSELQSRENLVCRLLLEKKK